MSDNMWSWYKINTYFVFKGRYYEQLVGAAIWSPISPIMVNLFMEKFEAKALTTSPHPQVCGIDLLMTLFIVTKSTHTKEFLNHINSIDEGIQFTAENPKADGSMPLLDTLLIPQSGGNLITTVFRKPNHTDQYMQWDSHHTIYAKYSVISTLFYRAKSVCYTSQ